MSTQQIAVRTRMPLFALYSATAISYIGSMMTMIAIPWFVLQTTGSPALTAIAAIFDVLPSILAAFFGGVLVDRLGYRNASILADITSGISVALVPLLYYTVGLTFWQLLILIFCSALFNIPGSTARSSLLPDLAALAHTSYERTNSIVLALQRGAKIIGAPLAGILVVLIGTGRVLWVDAATFAISALIITIAVPTGKRAAPAAQSGEEEGYGAQLAKGVRFILGQRLILAIVLTVMVTNFLDAPLFSVIMPVYAKSHLNSAIALGLTDGAFGAGALTGMLLFAAIGHKLPRRATFIGSFISIALAFWPLTTLPPLLPSMLILAIIGFASGPLNPIIYTVAQERVPGEMRGRVFGVVTAVAFAAVPLGILLAGLLLQWIGLQPTLLCLASSYLLVTLSLLLNQELKAMDEKGVLAQK